MNACCEAIPFQSLTPMPRRRHAACSKRPSISTPTTHGRTRCWPTPSIAKWHRDMSSCDSALDRALELAKKAIALGESDSNSLAALGWVYLFLQRYELAEHYYQKALELNPNTPNLMTRLAVLYAYTGRIAASIDCLRQAKLL